MDIQHIMDYLPITYALQQQDVSLPIIQTLICYTLRML